MRTRLHMVGPLRLHTVSTMSIVPNSISVGTVEIFVGETWTPFNQGTSMHAAVSRAPPSYEPPLGAVDGH